MVGVDFRQKEYICEKSLRTGKTRKHLVEVINTLYRVERQIAKIVYKLPLNKPVFYQVSNGAL